MNVFIWILQGLLALHTSIGALWKFSHSAEQTMPSLKMIPQKVWLMMAVIELICAIALVLPGPNRRIGGIAAIFITTEMLIFSGLHFSSTDTALQPVIYWLVVAMICAFVAYGKLQRRPL